MPLNYITSGSQTGSNNTELQITLETGDAMELNLIFESVGGNFLTQNATVQVSIDNFTWHTIDSAIALGTGNKVAKFYSPANRGTTLALNPCGFKYVTITIPALGANIAAKLTYSIIKDNYTYS